MHELDGFVAVCFFICLRFSWAFLFSEDLLMARIRNRLDNGRDIRLCKNGH